MAYQILIGSSDHSGQLQYFYKLKQYHFDFLKNQRITVEFFDQVLLDQPSHRVNLSSHSSF